MAWNQHFWKQLQQAAQTLARDTGIAQIASPGHMVPYFLVLDRDGALCRSCPCDHDVPHEPEGALGSDLIQAAQLWYQRHWESPKGACLLPGRTTASASTARYVKDAFGFPRGCDHFPMLLPQQAPKGDRFNHRVQSLLFRQQHNATEASAEPLSLGDRLKEQADDLLQGVWRHSKRMMPSRLLPWRR